MRQIKFICYLIITLYSISSFSQKELNSQGYLDAQNFHPSENIFIHYNSSLLLSGEYFYYKIYCINPTKNKSTILSKVAYLELINENKKTIIKHKINLRNGLGQGDFFIPTSIPSGNYKIIGYTEWMKNGGPNYFFRSDLSVINPYQVDQSSIMNKEKTIQKYRHKQNSSNLLSLKTNNNTYKKRSLVTVSLHSLMGTLGFGNYSISVRKIDSIGCSPKINAINYKKIYSNVLDPNNKSKLYYPEINGGLISGKVYHKQTNLPASNKNIAISMAGDNFKFKTEITDELGNFSLSIKESNLSKKGTIQVIGNDKENYKIELDEQSLIDLNQITFYDFNIDSSVKDILLKRSINNQIENVYYTIRPDTISSTISKKPFYSYNISRTYVLEEYTKFFTMKDVLLEIVEYVWTVNNNKGEREIYVRNVNNNNKDHLPLLFMDGIFIQDHQHILDYPPNKVKDIQVVQGNIQFNDLTYQGILIINTHEGDYENKLKGDFIIEKQFIESQPLKKYYFQDYKLNPEEYHRIPDLRNQLLWNPNVLVNSKENQVQFYTSDLTGYFEICLEGFNKHRQPISINKIIQVTD